MRTWIDVVSQFISRLLDYTDMLDTLTDHLIKPTQIILGLTPSCYTMDISILQYRHQLPR